LRLLTVVALVAVMIQGLLGGFRVRLNELVGTDLAAVHGVFAQVVFCLLIAVAELTGRAAGADLAGTVRRRLGWGSLALVGLLFVQLVWGVMVRHTPTPLGQRLHFLTAFLVVAVATWVLRAGFSTARARVAAAGWVLAGLIAVQLLLGVEAWMMKFGQYTLPELVPVTRENAAVRTAHVLVGTGVLATAVVLTLRVWRRAAPAREDVPATTETRRHEPRPALAAVGGVQSGETT
jgi:heme A synthase